MARISGVNISDNKHISIALTAIYGIGRARARDICKKCKINISDKTKDLNNTQLDFLNNAVNTFKVEGDLKREVFINIKRLIDLGTYRGRRHRRGLPARGQRTKTNAQTKKKNRKIVNFKKN